MSANGLFSEPVRWSLVFVGLWILMAVLACHLPELQASSGAAPNSAWLGLLVGGVRSEFSREWVGQADRFLHQGAGAYRPRVFNDVFGRISDALSPRLHTHLHGDASAEIMPWLWLAVRSDPHNVEAYVLAAFWMAGQVGRADLAEALLAEARNNNPYDYRVRLEQGRLFLKIGETDKAFAALHAAERLWIKPPSDIDPDQVRFDGAEILTYLALLKETFGDITGAVADYRKVVEWFPARAGLQSRIEKLEAGQAVELPPSSIWFERLSARRHVCDAEKKGMVEPHDHDSFFGNCHEQAHECQHRH